MAVLRPFKGLRYRADACEIGRLVAPPADSLTQSGRDAYAAQSDLNIVHATLPEARDDDRSKYIRYARSSALIADWRRNGLLAPDEAPVFYRLTQRYRERPPRTSLIALMRLEASGSRRTETATVRAREDRLRLLEATRTHLEPVLGVIEDQGEFLSALERARVGALVEAVTEDGVRHVVEPIEDEETIAALGDLVRDRGTWIVEGFARFEAALAFRQSIGDRPGDIPEDFALVALTSQVDPGLSALANHRIVGRWSHSTEVAIARLGEAFELEAHHPRRLTVELGESTLGVAFEGGRGYLLRPKPALLTEVLGESPRFGGLPVNLLHRVILDRLLGPVSADAISMTHDAAEAIRAADQGAAAAFLLPLTSIDDSLSAASAGDRLPGQTSHFFPKVPSGLVLWSLKDY